MIALDRPSREQREAIEAPFEGCFAILGAPATGKSAALAQRIARARRIDPACDPLILGSPRELHAYAAALLEETGSSVTLIDDVEAELLFRDACAPLFELRWPEFAENQLDPEVPGLRTPARFLQSAFRLIRRLRDAGIEPSSFFTQSLHGATEFYANPPNFADPSLLLATKNNYHDSLDVKPDELQRQYRRELDLAKILAKLYTSYIEMVNATRRMTGRDAVLAAGRRLREKHELAMLLRRRHRFAFVDEAQDLNDAELALLAAIFGESLSGVTLCGDPASAISVALRTAPEATFDRSSDRAKLREVRRNPHKEVFRATTAREEAGFIAERVAQWLRAGTPPQEVAVLFRSVQCVEVYENALLERGIPVAIAGDANVFADRRALDALALLWNVYDPFRHEWLLRTLAGHSLGLSDASIEALCGEPPDPQRPLFTFDDEPAPTVRSSRWNPKRDLRLGWNVIRGERDDALGEEGARRVRAFRAQRETWLEAMHAEPFEAFARRVWREGLAREGSLGSARARAQQLALRRLLDRLTEFLAQRPEASLVDILDYAESRAESDLETCVAPPVEGDGDGFVQMMSVDAAQGREFERVAIANVRPGAFPLWYAPEAFLFSPRLGMIPKENAGEAKAARTAKFSYYMFRTKAAQRYNDRERRALAYAMRRARTSVLVTAWGTPTRGLTAPELLQELR